MITKVGRCCFNYSVICIIIKLIAIISKVYTLVLKTGAHAMHEGLGDSEVTP